MEGKQVKNLIHTRYEVGNMGNASFDYCVWSAGGSTERKKMQPLLGKNDTKIE